MTWSPQPLDIAWCNFPYRENPDAAAPDAHPALVLLVTDARGKVMVAYGSSQLPSRLKRWHLLIPQGTIPALKKATVFDLDRRAAIPLTPEYFPDLPGNRACIGSLPARYGPQIAACIKASVESRRALIKRS